MTEHENDDREDLDGVTVTTITIRRYFDPDGADVIGCDIDGDAGLTMLLGMLELTKDTVIRQVMNDDDG